MAATALCQEMRHKPKIDEHVRASACVARNKRLKKQKKQKIISKDSHFRTEEFAAKLVQAGKVAVAVVKPGRGAMKSCGCARQLEPIGPRSGKM